MILLAAFLVLAAVLQQTTGQPSGFAALSTDKPDQRKEIVDKHNALRRKVTPTARDMLKMEWNAAAAQNAKKWANKCTLSHSPNSAKPGCGENLYMSSTVKSWSQAIQKWYDEGKNFIHGIGPNKPGAVIGHYTQVVWAKSYRIGCAVAYCPQQNYKFYYVCHYCPAGNNEDTMKTPYKSGKSCGVCPKACDNKLCKMTLLAAFLVLAAVLQQTTGQAQQERMVWTQPNRI